MASTAPRILETPSAGSSTKRPIEATAVMVPAPWPGDWTSLTVDGAKVLGLSEVKPKLALKVDEKEAPGVNGSTVTIQGRKLAKFDVTIDFGFFRYDDGGTETPEAQFASVVAMLRKLRPSKETALPITVDHPVFDLYGIKQVLVTEWDGPSYEGDLWRVKLSCLEYRKPSSPKKPATTTPAASDALGTDKPPIRPLEPHTLSQAERNRLADAREAAR